MSEKSKLCETCRWQYKTTTFDRSDGAVFWEEVSRWLKLDELGDTEWELCQIEGQKGYDTAWAIFKRRVSQGERKGKPPGPFSVIPMAGKKRPLLLFEPTQERRPVSVMVPDQLAQWLNELWAEREAGE